MLLLLLLLLLFFVVLGGVWVWGAVGGGGGTFVALFRFNAYTCMYSFTTNYDCFLWAKCSDGQL